MPNNASKALFAAAFLSSAGELIPSAPLNSLFTIKASQKLALSLSTMFSSIFHGNRKDSQESRTYSFCMSEGRHDRQDIQKFCL